MVDRHVVQQLVGEREAEFAVGALVDVLRASYLPAGTGWAITTVNGIS